MLRTVHRAIPPRQFTKHHLRSPISLLQQNIPLHRGIINIPTLLLPPLVFSGLLLTLWTWKCLMMVTFQNKIIYMPSVPPWARQEKISSYAQQCGGLKWREERTRAEDGTGIGLCVASVHHGSISGTAKRIYILYFQGNASSLPPRLPFLSPVLRLLRHGSEGLDVRYIMVCCSYRGYWTSKGRPSEKGIALDAKAALKWIQEDQSDQALSEKTDHIDLVIWGQSIGAGVATNLAAQQALFAKNVSLKTLILETPFLSIRSMLETLYPQKWLPYRYLWPFLRNHLDSWRALGDMREATEKFGLELPNVLILEAERDELVPSTHGALLERRCVDLGIKAERRVVHGALHTDVLVRSEGRVAVADAIRKVARAELDKF